MNIYNSLRIFIITIVLSGEFAALSMPKQSIISYLGNLNHKVGSAFIDVGDLDYDHKVYDTIYNSLYDKVLKDPIKYGFTQQEITDKIQMGVIEKIIHEIAFYASRC